MAAAAPMCSRRLAKELKQIAKSPPDGVSQLGPFPPPTPGRPRLKQAEHRRHPMQVSVASAADLSCWLINILGAPDTLYAGEKFQLQFRSPPPACARPCSRCAT